MWLPWSRCAPRRRAFVRPQDAGFRSTPTVMADSADPPVVYSGRGQQLAARIPRMGADVAVDGTLDDPVWRGAALLTGFSEYTPLDGLPSEDSTEVFVWYSPRAIYFGVRAFEPHGSVHHKLADRDKIDADDNIQIILSPFLHSRQAMVFAVNPLGIQEDGTMTEGVGGGPAAVQHGQHADGTADDGSEPGFRL